MINWVFNAENEGRVQELLGCDDVFEAVDFMPNHYFVVFYETNTEEVIGTGNISVTEKNEKLNIFIYDIVSEAKGNGKRMVDFMRNICIDGKVVSRICGEATESSIGFWSKMGAEFGEHIGAVDGVEFVINCEGNDVIE